MTISKIYCDHCGREINGIDDYTDFDIDLILPFHNVDLCEPCLVKLQNLVTDFLNRWHNED